MLARKILATRNLPLANSSKTALVDARDFYWLFEDKWYLVWQSKKYLYIIRNEGTATLYLHREIYKHHHEIAPSYVGHLNKNNLDNRLENLIPVRRGRVKSALLTHREEEIAALKVQGLTNSEIASKLYVVPETVYRHLSSIYKKFGVNNCADMIRILSENADTN